MAKLSDAEFFCVHDKYFWLDGGSMFGVVPRVFWEKYHPCDSRHRILIATRSLVVKSGGRVMLCDLGMGEKLSDKDIDFFAVDVERGNLFSHLEEHGIKREAVTDVFVTHLHFDHAGCATVKADNGEIVPAFPNAVYHVQREQFEWAKKPSERDDDSFNPNDFLPLEKHGVLNLIEGDKEVLPGIKVFKLDGHTPGMQVVRFDAGTRKVAYMGDLFPFASLVRMAWIMAYDLFPLKTLEDKKRILNLAVDESWQIVFEHDPKIGAVTIERKSDGGFKVKEDITKLFE